MPLPVGTVAIGGALIETTAADLTPSTVLRDVGAISLRAGRLRRVNAAGNEWIDIPGHVVAAVAPTTALFDGLLWYNTNDNSLHAYDGSAFHTVGGGTGSGITVVDDFPLPADAEAGVLYGDGMPNPAELGFLKAIGEAHEVTFRTAYLGNGFYGFASANRVFGSTRYRRGGDVSPLPTGLLAVAFHQSSTISNTVFVDVDLTDGLFTGETTSITIVITQEDGTEQTRVLDQVSTPIAGLRRFIGAVTVPSGENIWGAGEHNRISFMLSAGTEPLDIHGGTDVAEVVDEYSLQEERADIHAEIAPIDLQVEENTADIERLKSQGAEHDEVTEVYEETILGSDVFGRGVGSSGILWIDWFNDQLYGVSATHANGLQLPVHPDGGAARDGTHWYLLRGTELDVFNANLQGFVRSSTTLLAAGDIARGLATDADLTTGLATELWLMFYDASADGLAISTITPAADGSVALAQSFAVTLAEINILLGASFVELVDLTAARDIAVRGSALYILFDDLETTGGHFVSAILVYDIGGSGTALTLTASAVRAEDTTIHPSSLVEAPGGFLYLADGKDVYRFRERHTGIGFVRNVTGQGGPESDEHTQNDIQVDNDQPAAWMGSRLKIAGTNPRGVFNEYTRGNYLGEFPDDHSAFIGSPNLDVGDWFWETTHHKSRQWTSEAFSGDFWEDRRTELLLGNLHYWLGKSNSSLEALLRINGFDSTLRYVSAINDDLLQLDNDTWVAGSRGAFRVPVAADRAGWRDCSEG